MYDRNGNYLIVAILIGMILGVVVTAIFGEGAVHVKFLGDIFLNALKMIVIPLLFCSMIVGITNLGDIRKLGRTGVKTLAYFLATSAIAVVLGLILVNIVRPGIGFSVVTGTLPEAVSTPTSYSFFTWLTDQIPANIFKAAAETQVLPIIVVALFFGGVLTTIGAKGKPIIAFFDGINDVLMKIVHIIMWFAPIGIFGLVAGQLASEGGLGAFSSVLSALGKYVAVVLIGLTLHGVVILPLILKFFAGKSPTEYFVGMSQALTTAFATASSSATLPVTMECVEEKNDVDKRASSFVLPLGATINMDGTALYEAVAAMFIAQAYGIGLPIWSQITIFATAILASIGAAGIPQAGLVTMILVLQAVGLPLEGIGMILAIDWFLDRCRTTVNVWGDSIGAAVIASTKEIGLVERRTRPTRTRDKERPSRFKGFSSRRDQRRDDHKSAPATEGKPQPHANGRRSEDTDRSGSRSQQRRPKRKERSRSDRNRTERRDIKTVPPAPREEYKPKGAPAAGEAKKEVEKTPPKGQPAQQSPQQASSRDDRKQGYGRKRRRPQPGRGKSEESENRRGSNPAQSSEKPADAIAGQPKREFEVPKFPEKILDELSSRDKEDESGAKMRVSDRADLYDYGIHTRDLTVAEEEGEKTVSPEATETEATPSPVESEAAASSEEKSSEDGAFARLDEAVLGTSRNRPSDERPSDADEASEEKKEAALPEEATSEETAPPDHVEASFSSENEISELPSSSIDTEAEKSESVSAVESSQDTEKAEESGFEPKAVFETETDSEPKVEAEFVPHHEPQSEPEPTTEPGPEREIDSQPEMNDETEKAEESAAEEKKEEGEDEEAELWGRSKRRKASR